MVVLHTISEEYGRRSFVVTSGKSARMALFLPLNILEAEVIESNRSQLWRLKNIRAVYPLESLRGNIYKNTITMFMSEVLYRVLNEGAFEQGLAEWCEKMTVMLDAMESDFSNFHLRFLLELSIAMGFSPSVEDMAPFAGRHFSEIEAMLTMDFASFMVYPLSGKSRGEIAGSMLDYISFHTETAMEIRSISVLEDVFS